MYFGSHSAMPGKAYMSTMKPTTIHERVIRSVANLTRKDAEDFLTIAGRTPIRTQVVPYTLADANLALSHLRAGQLTGAAVLIPEH